MVAIPADLDIKKHYIVDPDFSIDPRDV